MKCCFIGHKEIHNINELKDKLNRILIELIQRYNVDNFLFGDKSKFNDLALEVVKNLKNNFSFIKLINYPSNDWYKGQENENIEFNKKFLKREITKFNKYVYLDYYGKY